MLRAVVAAGLLAAAGCRGLQDGQAPIEVDVSPPPVPESPALPPAPEPDTAPPPASVSVPSDFRMIVAVQAFLEGRHFSCGCVDGAFGSRTRAAVRAWQTRNGLPATGEMDETLLGKVGPVDACFAEHVVSADEIAGLTSVPESWREKAAQPRLGYETILEMIAEKYHATEGLIRTLNPEAPWPDPPEGTRVHVPRISSAPIPGAARVRIRLGDKTVEALDETGAVIALFPCSIARAVAKRPVGELKVSRCATDPNYMFDPALFSEEAESALIKGRLVIPPGPNNPVGTTWIGLDRPGYGIHGTPRPEDIGKTQSHGCFRLANWNAGKLLRMVETDTPVDVEP